jgi:hypothetical protein
MKVKLFCSIATLALSAGVQSRAQTATNVPGVFPNTNIVQSVVIGFAQGTCNDGTNTYWFGTDAIQQRNSHYLLVGGPAVYRSDITNGMDNFGPVHLGDPDYYQGYIYAPLESSVGSPKGVANIDIAIFPVTTLARYAAISVSNYQSEISAVCIDPSFSNSVALFATSWASTSTSDGIYEYSLNNVTNLTFVKALPMTQHIQYMQGIICVGGMLYVIGDNGPAGELYQVNPTNGVVTHLIQLNIAGETEWEGLDYFQGYLVATEAGSGTVNSYDFFGVQAASCMHRITGSVRDNRNDPIAGVGVIASATINGTNQIVNVDTDTNGNYSLELTNASWSVALNCGSGGDSLGNLGIYTCPASQNVNLLYNDVIANFIVQNCSVLIGTPAPLPAGEVGLLYNQPLQATSCYPGYTWTLTGGSLPSGLSLSGAGTISGTPSGSGTFNFTAQVTDANNSTANQAFSVVIDNPVQIATTSLPAGAVFDTSLTASNGQPPYIWSLSPSSPRLPSNFSLTLGGVLLGAATTYGTFNFSVRVKDNLAGIADQPLVVTFLQPLAISATGGQISVLWPAPATNYVLQSTTNLASPNWVTVSDAVPGTAYNVTNTAPQQFFRLQ